MRRGSTLCGLLLLVVLSLTGTRARAGGFVLYEFGAWATGRCGAQTAQANDASILFFNPAAMTRLEGTQASVGFSLIKPYGTYEAEGDVRKTLNGMKFGDGSETRDVVISDGTVSADQEDLLFYPPHLFITHRLGESLAAGFAFHTAYGLGVNWPRRWDGRYLIKQVDLQTFVLNPNVALDLAPLLGLSGVHLSLSAGYMAVYGRALLDRNIDLRTLALSGQFAEPYPQDVADLDGQVKMEGDGWAHSFNVALHFELPDLLAFGAQYRHGFPLEFEGDADFTVPAWFTKMSFLGLSFPDTTGSTSMQMPNLLNMGIALLAIPNLALELDLFLEDWSGYDELQVKWACNDEEPKCGIPQEPMVKDWESNYQISFGAEYTFDSQLALRAGVGRVGTPVPEDTFDPMLPDGERTLLTFGLGYPFSSGFRADIGYMLAFWEGVKTGRQDGGGFVNDIGGPDDTTENGRAIGTYSTTSHILGLTVGGRL